MTYEHRIGWAIFDKDSGEMSLTSRWPHAKACMGHGHEVLRIEFDRPIPPFGERAALAGPASSVNALEDCMTCGRFLGHGHDCGKETE